MIKAFLADDHAILRDGLRQILERQPDIDVVGEADSGDTVLGLVGQSLWDVLVLDLSLPGRSGIDLVQQIIERDADSRILILTMRPEDQFAVRLLEAGAKGYITKGSSASEVIAAIRCVAAGKEYLTDSMVFQIQERKPRARGLPHESLSSRETDIFRLFCGGATTGDISDTFDLSNSTISTHLKNIRIKLGVNSNREIINYSRVHGLFPD